MTTTPLRERIVLLTLACSTLMCHPVVYGQSGANIETAIPLGDLGTSLTQAGTLTLANPTNYYRFSVTNPIRAVDLHLSAGFFARVVLLSWPDRDAPPVVLEGGESSSFRDAFLRAWLDSGEYFVRAEAMNQVLTDLPYTLEMSQEPKPDSSGAQENTVESARPLGALTTRIVRQDWVGAADIVDYFRFRIDGATRIVTAHVKPNSMTMRAELLTWPGPGRDPEVLAAGESRGGFQGYDIVLERDLAPGDYLVTVRSTAPAVGVEFALELSQTLPPGTLPFLLEPVQSVIVPAGGTAEFLVRADGIEPLTYQWRFKGDPVAGATNALFRIEEVTALNEGTYTVDITNPFGTQASEPASLTLRRAGLEFGIRLSVTISWPQVVDGADVSNWILEHQPMNSAQWSPSPELVRAVSEGIVQMVVPMQGTNGVMFRLRAP